MRKQARAQSVNSGHKVYALIITGRMVSLADSLTVLSFFACFNK
jgi:hypothetical protein